MAGNIKGITIEIGGETSKLQSAIKKLNAPIRQVENELRDVNRLLKFDGGNHDLLVRKEKLLNQAISETKNKLTELKNAKKRADAEMAKGGEVSQEQYHKLQREIDRTEAKLKGLENEFKKFGSVSAQQVAAVGNKIKSAGTVITNAGNALRPVSLAATGALALSGRAFVSFDDSMRQVQATMGGTVEDFEKLKAAAEKAGRETKYTASESADALNYLALAGYDANGAIETLPSVLRLAQAGGMDLAAASDMVTDSITALGKSTEYTETLVDQMAKTASNSNTSIAQLGEGFLKVGATAREMSGGTVELNTVLGLLADNGIKAAEGGTHLRNILLALDGSVSQSTQGLKELGVSTYDTNGNLRSMEDIFQDLNNALSGMTDEEKQQALSKIFNKTDLAAVNALLGTSVERWEELGAAIGDSEGYAKQMADTMEGGIGGSLRKMKSALEGMAISIGDALAPSIDKLSNAISDFANWFNELPDGVQKIAASMLVFMAALAPVLIVLGSVTKSVGSIMTLAPTLTSAFSGVSGAVSGVVGSLGAVAPVVLAVVAAIGALVAACVYLFNTNEEFANSMRETWAGLKESFTGVFEAVRPALDKLMGSLSGFIQTLAPVLAQVAQMLAPLLSGWISAIAGFFSGLLDTVSGVINFIVALLNGDWKGAWEAAKSIVQGVVKAIGSIINGITSLVKAVADKIVEFFKAAGEKIKAAWSSVTGFFSALWQGVVATVSSVASSISARISALGSSIKSIFSSAVAAVKSVWGSIVSFFQNIGNRILAVFRSLPSKMASIGRNIVQGIINGVSGAAGALIARLRSLATQALNAAKSALGIHSPSRVFQEVVGKNIVAGIESGIYKYADNATDAMKEVSQKIVSEAEELMDIQTSLGEMTAEQQLDFWKKIREEEGLIGEDLLKVDKKIFDAEKALLEEQEKAQEEYTKNLEERTNRIANFASIFAEVTREKIKGQDLINNLREQIWAIEDYAEAMQNLAERGVSANLLTELQEQGVSAIDEIVALTRLTDDKLKEYDELFTEKNKLAGNIAAAELQGLATVQVVADYGQVSDVLNEAAAEVVAQQQAEQTTLLEDVTTKTAAVVGQSLLSGLAGIQNAIFAALPEKLNLTLDGKEVAKALWLANDEEGARRSRLFAPSENDIRNIALKALANVGNF